MYCKRRTQKDQFVQTAFPECNRKVKYKVGYYNPVNGKWVEEFLCGIHYNSTKKSIYVKGSEFDPCMTIIEKL